MNKTLIIVKREYLKVVRKVAFWASTLMLPALIVIVSLISGISAQQSEQKILEKLANANTIYVYDDTNNIKNVKSPFKFTPDFDLALNEVKTAKADGLIYFPKEISIDGKVQIFMQDQGLFLSTRFNDASANLLKQSILEQLDDESLIALFNKNLTFQITQFNQNGEEIKTGLEMFIVPAVAALAYFILTSFAVSYMLMSVSEEKENRVIEILLSTVNPKELIIGKIIGIILTVLTQLVVLVLLAIGAFLIFNPTLPGVIDFSKIVISPVQVLLAIFYTLSGFLFLSSVMVGVGAAMPNYKDASSFSSVFILLSVIPIYFASLIAADPNGLISILFSYFPFTSSLLTLFRSALGVMSPFEIMFSFVVQAVYAMVALFIAFKLFEIGALEFRSGIRLKRG